MILVALLGAYLALVLHPQPLFAYSLQRGNVVLHARAPFPLEASAMLEDVVHRVSQSPLDDSNIVHDVFLCDTPALFTFFTLWDHNAGGVTHGMGARNVFIRPADIRRGRVIGPNGKEKEGERTLTYYIAHELTHAISIERVGAWRYRKLAAFQVEGYADYVAFAKPFDVARGRADFIAGDPDMMPSLSGHYDRYRLFVSYLLDRRGLTVDELLGAPMDPKEVERGLLDADL